MYLAKVIGQVVSTKKEPPLQGVRLLILRPMLVDEEDNPKGLYPVPEKAHIMVSDGDEIGAGTMIAKTPREITGTQDIDWFEWDAAVERADPGLEGILRHLQSNLRS